LNSATEPQQAEGKRKGRDGKLRRMPKRKPKTAPKLAPAPIRPALNLPPLTREQLKAPPGVDAVEHAARWGSVHIASPDDRVRDAKQINARSFSSAVRAFGEAAQKFLAAKGIRIPGTLRGEPLYDPNLATHFTPEEYLTVLATMQNGGKLWRDKLEEHLDTLIQALQLSLQVLEPYAKMVKERAANVTNNPEQIAPDPAVAHFTRPLTVFTDDIGDMPECLKRSK
jgi:hypothetical protein